MNVSLRQSGPCASVFFPAPRIRKKQCVHRLPEPYRVPLMSMVPQKKKLIMP